MIIIIVRAGKKTILTIRTRIDQIRLRVIPSQKPSHHIGRDLLSNPNFAINNKNNLRKSNIAGGGYWQY